MSERITRILVVEDDATLRDALAEVLGDEGHEVRAASHGLEAIDQLTGWDADVILLDLMMPTMDAYEFRAHQLRLGFGSGARTLILSAARDVEDAAIRLEADAWLAKPFRLAEVLAEVDRLLDLAS